MAFLLGGGTEGAKCPLQAALLLFLSANQKPGSRTLWTQARDSEREGPGTKGVCQGGLCYESQVG